jgi:hypothetical protein
MQPSSSLRSFLLATTVCAGFAMAQGASFQTFGTGCAFNQQALLIGNQGLPQIGTTLTITYTGPNTNNGTAQQQIIWPQLALGFGLRNTPIPQNLLPQQPAGCQGLITVDAVMPTAPRIGIPIFQDHIDLPVPNSPALRGLRLYAQWLSTVQQCGFAGCNLIAVVTSDAAVIVVG